MKARSGSPRVRAAATVAASAALLLAAFGSSTGSASAAVPAAIPAQTINIATISDLSGPASVIGIAGNQGQRVAVAVVNSNPKKYLCSPNRKLAVTYDDATNSVSTALTITRNIVNDGQAVAIVGPLFTAQAESMASVTQAAKISMLIPYTPGSTDQTGKGDFVFAQSQPDTTTAITMANALSKAWPNDKVVGILYASDSAAHVQQQALDEKALQAKGKTVVKYSVPFASLDMNSAIASFKSQGVQTIYILLNSPAQIAAMQAATRAGYQPHWFGYTTTFDNSVIAGGGAQAQGALLTADYNPSVNTPLVKQFQAVFQKSFGKQPNSWAALGYQSIMNVAAAMCKINGKVTRTNFQPALAKILAPSILNGGVFRFNAVRLNAIPPAVLQIKGDKFVTWKP